MIRARSAMLRKAGTVETELDHQAQKNKMLEQDRRQFLRQAEEIKEKYAEEMDKLKNQNKKLKGIRDQFIASKKNRCVLSRASLGNLRPVPSTNDENYLRLTLDKEKHDTKAKKNVLFTLQDKLKEIEENKMGFLEENPMVRTTRLLQNRLDKVMIKFNEAQAIQQTYEEVVRRLKEERVGYDSQLASIENCLKGKEHDFQQLLLLAHDATHAKQAAFAELKRFEQRRVTVQQMRSKYVSEKKEEVGKDLPQATEVSFKAERSTYNTKSNALFSMSYKHDENYQRQELNDYEQAFRKLKEVTGVVDANEIIQKYKTQGLTTNSLQELQLNYSKKIEDLKTAREQLKKRLEEARFVREKQVPQRRRLDEIESQLARISNQHQRVTLKYSKLSNSMIDITAGVQHIKELTAFYRVQNELEGENIEEGLKNFESKMRKIYDIIRSDPNYAKYGYRVSANAIQAMLRDQQEYKSYKGSALDAEDEEDQD